ncbi:MAG: formate dehydrogenase [Burkholderiales bacterium]|nr:formate dehydrogenase [Burkholderiales bacterium]
MSDGRPLLSRRHFLFALGTGSAAAAVTVAARASGEEQAPQAAAATTGHSTRGYRESAHIARYYRSTRI